MIMYLHWFINFDKCTVLIDVSNRGTVRGSILELCSIFAIFLKIWNYSKVLENIFKKQVRKILRCHFYFLHFEAVKTETLKSLRLTKVK